MVSVRKILCPVDFYPASEAALLHAASFAKSYKARLRILHVIPPVSSFTDLGIDRGNIVKAAHEKSKVQLARMVQTLTSLGIQATTEIRFGEIDRQILGAIDEYKAGLVVAGTRGRRGFQHWLMGSVLERLLRKVPVPIVSIGRGRKRDRLADIQNVLIAVDFTDECAGVASYGFDFARHCGARVTVLHVPEFVIGDIADRYKRSFMTGLHLELEKLVPPALAKSMSVATRVEFGYPHSVILKSAERLKADLIVVGTQSKGLLDRALVGSNAERIIRGAACAVLAIPPTPEEKPRRKRKS